jgi:propanediol dehydratase large subunit
MSESHVRRTSRTLPILLAGSDYICSGFGSIQRYDNMFGPSNWNAEDIDDWLAMQRDWGVDGGLRTAPAESVGALRLRAAQAVQAVYAWFGLADFSEEQVAAAVDAAGSKDLAETDEVAVLNAARTIRETGLTMADVVTALYETGFEPEAARLLDMLKARIEGDYLQTAAIFTEDMRVLSLVTDPNDYAGPGTGYEPSPERQAEIDAIRQQRSVEDLRHAQAAYASDALRPKANGSGAGASGAPQGSDPRDVVIGVSPATGRDIWLTLSGMPVVEVLRELLAGLEEEGCAGRIVRINDTIDLGMIGLTAARLSGSGIGIGLQGKGTALIHRRDLPPLANLELYSIAPVLSAADYRLMGVNAARHAKGATPVPARNPYTDEAIEARYHTKVVSLVAIERTHCSATPPEELTL